DPDLGRKRIVEKFLVSTPPERIIHHRASRERFVFEPGAIEGHVLRDAIDHHFVTARLALDDLVDFDEFRADIFATGLLIHPLNKRRRKTVFLTKKDSDFFHSDGSVKAHMSDR